jgi:hypothetical protein
MGQKKKCDVCLFVKHVKDFTGVNNVCDRCQYKIQHEQNEREMEEFWKSITTKDTKGVYFTDDDEEPGFRRF